MRGYKEILMHSRNELNKFYNNKSMGIRFCLLYNTKTTLKSRYWRWKAKVLSYIRYVFIDYIT